MNPVRGSYFLYIIEPQVSPVAILVRPLQGRYARYDLDRVCTFNRRRLPRLCTVGLTGSHTDSVAPHLFGITNLSGFENLTGFSPSCPHFPIHALPRVSLAAKPSVPTHPSCKFVSLADKLLILRVLSWLHSPPKQVI